MRLYGREQEGLAVSDRYNLWRPLVSLSFISPECAENANLFVRQTLDLVQILQISVLLLFCEAQEAGDSQVLYMPAGPAAA